jgi:hypothetical protein
MGTRPDVCAPDTWCNDPEQGLLVWADQAVSLHLTVAGSVAADPTALSGTAQMQLGEARHMRGNLCSAQHATLPLPCAQRTEHHVSAPPFQSSAALLHSLAVTLPQPEDFVDALRGPLCNLCWCVFGGRMKACCRTLGKADQSSWDPLTGRCNGTL